MRLITGETFSDLSAARLASFPSGKETLLAKIAARVHTMPGETCDPEVSERELEKIFGLGPDLGHVYTATRPASVRGSAGGLGSPRNHGLLSQSRARCRESVTTASTRTIASFGKGALEVLVEVALVAQGCLSPSPMSTWGCFSILYRVWATRRLSFLTRAPRAGTRGVRMPSNTA